MSAARDKLLADVRAALGGGRADPGKVAHEAATLIGLPEQVQPQFPEQSNLERFIVRVRSERLTASLAQLQSYAEVPAAAAAYLKQAGLAPNLALVKAERLSKLNWDEIALHHDLAPNEAVAMSLAAFGIAETGSLVMESGPASPTLFSFLPLHHLVVVEAGKILRTMEDYWAARREQGSTEPRAITFVTGTSGTADIEARNVRGAHGPRYLHILVVETP